MSSTGGRIAGDKSSQGGEADGEMRRTNRKRGSHVRSEGSETGATQEEPMQRSKGERGRKVGSGRVGSGRNGEVDVMQNKQTKTKQ